MEPAPLVKDGEEEKIELKYSLPDGYWDAFMDDIGHKTLLTELDKGILLRNQLVGPDVEANDLDAHEKFKRLFHKARPLNMLATAAYISLCVWEKPAWCVNPAPWTRIQTEFKH